MFAKLYKVGENRYVVADDIFLQLGVGDWVASEILEEEDLLALIFSEMDLSDFEMTDELAEPLEDFVEVPREQWAGLPLP